MPIRTASAIWADGGLQAGKGSFKTQTGLASTYSFGTRFQEVPGSNPEELLAAAHAACFSMALSVGLDKNGTPPVKIETKAACTIEKVGDAFKITTMTLDVTANVPKIDDASFQKIAAATKDGCPVSGALKGNVNIVMTAQLG